MRWNNQRVFSFGDSRLYLLEWIAVICAVASGVALALVNLVMGNFLSLLSDFSFTDGASVPSNFMSAVQTSAYEYPPSSLHYQKNSSF